MQPLPLQPQSLPTRGCYEDYPDIFDLDSKPIRCETHKYSLTKSKEKGLRIMFYIIRFEALVNRGTNVDSHGPRCFPFTVTGGGPRFVVCVTILFGVSRTYVNSILLI